MNFKDKLAKARDENDSLLCIGLDPDLSRIPPHIAKLEHPVFEFCKAIVDATYDLVCAYKPQIAYFAAESAESQLEHIIEYVNDNYPHIPVILDSKRGDIGATADKYAIEAFERYKADAVTVNPYMGFDTVEPFLRFKEKGVIVLCRTSNAGAGDIQDLEVAGRPLYHYVAEMAVSKWNVNDNCMLVVGATWPKQIEAVRSIVGDMELLVPGVGAQGGDVEALVNAGQTRIGDGMIINSSRAILYASNEPDFKENAREVAKETRDSINQYRLEA